LEVSADGVGASENRLSDGVYAWLQKYGKARDEAFFKVKEILIKAAEAGINAELDQLDQLDIGITIKWKIAYLFNPSKVIPIFKKDVLSRAAASKGLVDSEKQGVAKLQNFLLQFKPDDISTLEYAFTIWDQFNVDNFFYVIEKFLRQAKTDNLKKTGFPKSYRSLEVNVSFGAGNTARIPWIALLKSPNKVSNGIYPVYLYYKEFEQLILAYGVSETVEPGNIWENEYGLQTVDEWFNATYGVKPARYGGSFVKSVYDLNEELLPENLQMDLDEILEFYSNQKIEVPSLVEEDREEYGKKYWIVAPGDGASEWDRFYSGGYIGISWDEVSDLSSFSDRDSIREELLRVYPSNGSHSNNSLALWEFSKIIKPGDILITKKGVSKYVGYGIVTSEYYFEADGGEYPHRRKVEWKKRGEWPEEVHNIIKKTLTNITKYPEYVDRLKRLIGIEQEAVIPEIINYWWLNANPDYWKIDDFEVGQEQSYTSYNERGNKRRIYEYFKQVKPGDLILGYESSPVKKVLAIFEVSKGLYTDEDSGLEQFSFIIQKFLPDPIAWNDLKDLPQLKNCEVIQNNQGSLFKLTKNEYEAILNREVEVEKEEYSLKNALSELFLSEEELTRIVESVRYKKNIILQGPPGTGKTFMAKRLAYLMLGEKDDSKIEMVQFHQSYSYEDFMQGYRPTEEGRFKLENGVFFRFCKRAQADPDRDYFFIIDEINRGNLSKIFGELMLLIEKDKRGKKHAVNLTYSTSIETKFHIPENIYLIGTMNTADRSLAVVDYALRRRFAFITMQPMFNEKFRNHLLLNSDEETVNSIMAKIESLNSTIKLERNLGEGFQIGHSYFCNPDTMVGDEKWFHFVVENEIGPLIEEYWFDNLEMARSLKSNLLA
jgi:5-methylcytosine-specific restriction protein B